jgi:hypothetical protein
MGATSARGIALLVGAVLLGIILLKATDPPDSLADAAEGAPVATTTTSTTAGTSTTADRSDGGSSTTTEAKKDENAPLVLVANAANRAGVAGRLSATIEQADLVVAPPANASVDATTSTVYFAPGFEDAARKVAELFDPHPATAPMPDTPPVAAGDLAGANVILVAGPDLAG